jgi:hypothetical protein
MLPKEERKAMNKTQTLGDRPSILNNNLLNRRGLTSEQYVILRELVNLRATTPSRFEIETSRIGQNLKDLLDCFISQGLAESEEQNREVDKLIYTPTLEAIRFVTRTERENMKKQRDRRGFSLSRK